MRPVINRIRLFAIVGAAALVLNTVAIGQGSADRVSVPLTDPSRPATVKVNLLVGGITIKGSSGREVVVQSDGRGREQDRPLPPDAAGLRRLNPPSGLAVEEENNIVSIRAGWRHANLEIQVPARANLSLRTVAGGEIVVEGVEGEIEVNTVSGSIRLTGVAGSVVAHATNGKVVATVARVAADRPMAFTAMNGSVDVTLPPTVKAELKLRSDNGDIFSDFDVQMKAAPAPSVSDLKKPVPPNFSDSRKRVGRYRIEPDRSMYGSINGGGPLFELRTFSGNVYLRRGK